MPETIFFANGIDFVDDDYSSAASGI